MIDTSLITKQKLFNLLSSRFSNEEKKLSQIPNPALLQDASSAAKKITDAIRENKKITLVGDYDVDGVSSTAIMVDFLDKFLILLKLSFLTDLEMGMAFPLMS